MNNIPVKHLSKSRAINTNRLETLPGISQPICQVPSIESRFRVYIKTTTNTQKCQEFMTNYNKFLKRWSGRGSNPQPVDSKPTALPIELPPHQFIIPNLCCGRKFFGSEGNPKRGLVFQSPSNRPQQPIRGANSCLLPSTALGDFSESDQVSSCNLMDSIAPTNSQGRNRELGPGSGKHNIYRTPPKALCYPVAYQDATPGRAFCYGGPHKATCGGRR